MKQSAIFFSLSGILFLFVILLYSCSKGGGNGGGTPPVPCAGVTITVTGTVINPSTGSSNGSINASAAGSSGFTFSLNGAAFQSPGNFNNLAAGTYTVMAKDMNGCTGAANFTLTAPNLCTGTTITVSAVTTANRPCEISNGSITATGAGGTPPYTYNINGGIFQSSNVFPGLAATLHIIVAKDANGCTGAVNTVVNNLPPGTLFAAVKNLVVSNCVSCHNGTVTEGGMDWTIDCNIVNFKDRIRARAVTGNPSAMPPTGLLPASEQLKITNWINAGGRFTD
ncbi:MAG: SprB repeat-containing protein [Ferruginibacter sp.]|nr:SprB repeat-containing protein [Chitinophagaceae bacterium]